MANSRYYRKFLSLMAIYGIDIKKGAVAIRNTPRLLETLCAFRKVAPSGPLGFAWSHFSPYLADFDDQAGAATGHYFYQDLWAARKIYAARPTRHLDIGSRIDGFVSHLLTFMPVTVIDIRPLTSTVEGLTFMQADGTDLAGVQDDSVESLSSLHAVEHFGLGRYGDAVDPDACFRAMNAMDRVLRPGGRLYFSTPLGVERVNFNAHRVFAPSTIMRVFSHLTLVSFAAVDDGGNYVGVSQPEDHSTARFACGLFEYMK